jgi:hypothetical protein
VRRPLGSLQDESVGCGNNSYGGQEDSSMVIK